MKNHLLFLFLSMGIFRSSTINAQFIQTMDVNTSVTPYTLHVQSYVYNLIWHEIVQTYDQNNNTHTVDFQFVGHGNSNAMSYFDTTIVLSNVNNEFDLCVNVQWLQGVSDLPPYDTVLLDNSCLTASEILSIDLNNISFKAPSIFPNPAQDHVFIVFDENADVSQTREVKVYDLSGVLQFTREMKTNDYVLEIKTENMAKGMYLVVISAEGKEISTQKVAVR